MEGYAFSESHYEVARDVFLFGCYTGLRMSDILKAKEIIFTNKEGMLTWHRNNMRLENVTTSVWWHFFVNYMINH